ncbi:hypothetical protein AB3S75_020098 [Citrus x aurantiifolia]
MQPDEFLDWLHSVERVFDYKDVPEQQNVKLATLKLRKYASLWWENLKRQRAREGRKKIVSWEKMKREPDNYRQDNFLKFHNLKQKDLFIEESTAEFEQLMMKCDMVEPEEQTISHYLGGLRIAIGNMVQLRPYWTLQDVCKLAIKVERQQKEARNNSSQSYTRPGSFSRSHPISVKRNSAIKSSPEVPQNGEVGGNLKQPASTSNTNSRRCFKCQGYGHIASDCPNRRIITLVEEESDGIDETDTKNPSDEEKEVTYADEGESLILRKALSSNHVEDQEDWL